MQNIIPICKIVKTESLVNLIGELDTVIGAIAPDRITFDIDPTIESSAVFDRDFGVIYFKSQGQKEAMLN